MAFKFRLQSVLTIRRRERDLQHQLVAEARVRLEQLVDDEVQLAGERSLGIRELRSLTESDNWNSTQVVHRQRHLDQLADDLAIAATTLESAKRHLAECLQCLIVKDQIVQTLERLAERQLAEYRIWQLRSDAREFDEAINRQPRAA